MSDETSTNVRPNPSAPAGTMSSGSAPGGSAPGNSASGGNAPANAAATSSASSAAPAPSNADGNGAASVDLRWVWTEVRKRVFIKVPFSLPLAEAMESAVPIVLEGDTFVCGLPPNKFTLSSQLTSQNVRNTIEGILQQAAGRRIHFQVIEGTVSDDWQAIKERQQRAQEAMIAIGEQKVGSTQYEDVLNQIVGEIRQRVTATRDRNFPLVRARLILDTAAQLGDAIDMLFPDQQTHEAGRALTRTIDRIAGFLEIPPVNLAMEIERHQRLHGMHANK